MKYGYNALFRKLLAGKAEDWKGDVLWEGSTMIGRADVGPFDTEKEAITKAVEYQLLVMRDQLERQTIMLQHLYDFSKRAEVA